MCEEQERERTTLTFAGGLVRLVRHRPGMGDGPLFLPVALATATLAALIGGSLGAVGIVAPFGVDDGSSIMVLLLTAQPPLIAHIQGVRHRWWALAAGVATGLGVGVGLVGPVTGVAGPHWAELAGVVAGSWVGTVVHAAVTNAPASGPGPA